MGSLMSWQHVLLTPSNAIRKTKILGPLLEINIEMPVIPAIEDSAWQLCSRGAIQSESLQSYK